MAWTRAQETFLAADSRNPQPGRLHAIELPGKILDPDEAVYEYLQLLRVGDSWPLPVVTDRRIIRAGYSMFRSWGIKDQVPSPDVVGAELENRMLSRRVHVIRRSGTALTVKVAHREWSEHVVGLINHLAAGGEPHRV